MANSVVAKLVIFTILLNLASGFMMLAVVDSEGNKIFDTTSMGGHAFETEGRYGDDFKSELEKTIQPAGSLDDKGDQIYRVLDMMSLGFIYRFVNIVDTYMYGFINILDNVLGQYMGDEVRVWLFGDRLYPGMFKILISIAYILFGISLFTGKDVLEGR